MAVSFFFFFYFFLCNNNKKQLSHLTLANSHTNRTHNKKVNKFDSDDVIRCVLVENISHCVCAEANEHFLSIMGSSSGLICLIHHYATANVTIDFSISHRARTASRLLYVFLHSLSLGWTCIHVIRHIFRKSLLRVHFFPSFDRCVRFLVVKNGPYNCFIIFHFSQPFRNLYLFALNVMVI